MTNRFDWDDGVIPVPEAFIVTVDGFEHTIGTTKTPVLTDLLFDEEIDDEKYPYE